MKLIIAIVREKFFDKLLVELMEADVHVTKLNSTGGFFKKQNTTLLIGTEAKDLDKIDEIFKANCKTEILEKDGEITYQEGCLSVPEFFEDVTRSSDIKVRFQNRFGEFIELSASELLAVCVQHEMDHLDGHLFIEKISYSQKKKFSKEYKKRLKEKSK